GDPGRLAGPLVRLLRKGALAPVDPAVGAEVRAMQVVGASGKRLALEPLRALVGHAVTVGVGQLPDAGRGRDVERAVVPEGPLGKHHLVRKDRALVEPAISVAVYEPDDAMRLLSELLLHLVVGAR